MGRDRGLSLQAVRLLAVMLEDPAAEYWGTDLMRRLEIKSGTLYPLLDRLENDRGLLASRSEPVDPAQVGRPARRLYRLTGEGEAVARAEVRKLDAALARLRPQLGST